jgi:sporulation protein YlmC with PRC-barrel domain
MERISDLISKNVLSLSSGNKIGYIIDIVFDKEIKSVCGFIVVDEESEQNFLVKDKDIKSYKEDCCVIENEARLEACFQEESNNPIGKEVFDENGVSYGNVKDVLLQSNKVKKIVTAKCEFPARLLKVAGNKCLIFGKKSQKNKNKKINYNYEKLNNVSIQKNNFENENLNKIKNNDKIFKNVVSKGEKPIRLSTDSNKLIGRKINKDLFGLNNELIAKKNTILTKKIIEKAKRHNKFNLLLFYIDR